MRCDPDPTPLRARGALAQAPKWNEKENAWCLNFNGRVSKASVKTSSWCRMPTRSTSSCSSARRRGHLHHGLPVAVQRAAAFAIYLTSFDSKLACSRGQSIMSRTRPCRFVQCGPRCARAPCARARHRAVREAAARLDGGRPHYRRVGSRVRARQRRTATERERRTRRTRVARMCVGVGDVCGNGVGRGTPFGVSGVRGRPGATGALESICFRSSTDVTSRDGHWCTYSPCERMPSFRQQKMHGYARCFPKIVGLHRDARGTRPSPASRFAIDTERIETSRTTSALWSHPCPRAPARRWRFQCVGAQCIENRIRAAPRAAARAL